MTRNTDNSTLGTEKSPREIVHLIVKRYLDNDINDHQLENELEKALRDRDERAAKIADERAAFNRRLAKTHGIGDPMADLKFTRADEAEVIAGEIRGKS